MKLQHQFYHFAPLHRNGTDKWSKAKQKAAEKASDVATELLDIYARSAAETGQCFKKKSTILSIFCRFISI